jgi:hypothetical protein
MTLEDILIRTGTRQAGFRLMLDHLKSIDNPLIIETGCARAENNLEGDGWSSVIWDRYVVENTGSAYSVDISAEHVEFTRNKVQKLNVVLSDSIKYLHEKSKEDISIDLLYLDSYDYTVGEEHNSAMHHIHELACITSKISPGGLVAVDDCWIAGGRREGKGKYVFDFMNSLGKELIYDGYQMIWRW